MIFLKKIILLIKEQLITNLLSFSASIFRHIIMKSRQSTDRMVMIAEQILKDSVSQSGLKKLNDIKKSLEVRSSKARKKSHEKSKQKVRQLSHSRKVPQSPKAYSEVRKRSVSRPQDTYTRSYSRLSSVDNTQSRTRKRSVRFSLQHQYPQTNANDRRSPLKQNSNNQSQKTILKQSSFKKPSSPRMNQQSQIPTAKAVTKNDNRSLAKKPTLQNFSADHIVAKKLFGDQVTKSSKPVVQSEISFNLNLNKLLKIVEKVLETEKGQKENVYSSSKGSKKDILLSQENMKLIKRIGKQLGSNGRQDMDLEEGFKKKTLSLVKQTPIKKIDVREQQQDRRRQEYRIDYISQESQGRQKDVDQYIRMELGTGDKSDQKKFNSGVFSTQYRRQEPQQFSVTTQKYESSHSVNTNNLNTKKPQKQSKQLNQRLTQRQIMEQMNQKIMGLRRDKEWLVGTVESLLSQNEQLKKLLVGTNGK